MRRFLSLAIGALALLVLGAPLLSVEAAPRLTGLLQGGRNVSTCQAEPNKIANPNVILLGETVDITLTVRANCASETAPLHIVMVLDGSGSMAGAPTQDMKKAAAELIRKLEMDRNPGIQVGVVEFNTQARTLCQLTNQESRAVGCVNNVQANGGTAIDLGILEGLQVLRRGRRTEIPPREVMIVLSDGGNNAGCDPVLAACRASARAATSSACAPAPARRATTSRPTSRARWARSSARSATSSSRSCCAR
jgi:hypothetical protein